MNPALAASYERLAEIAERELELAADGTVDELERLALERAALVARLPERPPAAARAVLERCALLHRRTTMELVRAREAVLLELAAIERVRRAAHGYRPSRRRAPRVEASA